MTREYSHFEGREPFFEKILSRWRTGLARKYIPANSRILDLGCGFTGSFLKKIENNISHGVGVDVSVSKELNSPKLELIEHDLNDPLPFSDDNFDIVTSLANLEHLNKPDQYLNETYRVLKPGGKLLLTTPSLWAKPVLELLSRLGLISRREIEDHKNYFSKKILASLCKKAGFSSISHRYFQFGMNNFLYAKK